MEAEEQLKHNYHNLDLLRSMAVLAVFSAHLWRFGVQFDAWPENHPVTVMLHNLSGCGVMFFFVHTCLVLMLSMRRAPAENFVRNFYLRRAFRIYPLCWLAILLAVVPGWTDRADLTPRLLGWNGIAANFLLVQNLIKLPGGLEASVLGPLWSLPWEVQMYLVLPFFFLLLRRFRAAATVFALWSLFAACAFLLCQPRLEHLHLQGSIYVPMFVSGMAAFRLLEWQQENRNHGLPRLPAWGWPLALTALFALPTLQPSDHWLKTPQGSLLGSLVCLALGCAIPCFHSLRAGWITGSAARVARYSYGIYLLHVPALYIAFRLGSGLPVAARVLLALLLTGAAAVLTFHLLEDPMIRLGKRLSGAETADLPMKQHAIETPASAPQRDPVVAD